jgi:hypothetical protein
LAGAEPFRTGDEVGARVVSRFPSSKAADGIPEIWERKIAKYTNCNNCKYTVFVLNRKNRAFYFAESEKTNRKLL